MQEDEAQRLIQEYEGRVQEMGPSGEYRIIEGKRTNERCDGLIFKRASESCRKTKAEIAKANAKRVAKEIQRYSEERNEADLASQLRGVAVDDNEPHDVQWRDHGRLHGIELKTMTDNANRKLTMKRSAMDRKSAWTRKNKAYFHTVVFDDTGVIPGSTIDQKTAALNRLLENADEEGFDFSKRKIYYRRGFGSFRVDGMYEVRDMRELRRLLRSAVDDLPKGAK
jgi:hypothetical protein